MVSAESWRDFISEAPDYELEIYSGVPFYLDLQDLLIQGAVSFDGESPIPDTSEEAGGGDPLLYDVETTPLRGWRYAPLVIEKPTNGKVDFSRDKRGWTITSEQGYVGKDCFNYFLTNDFQASNFGKVNLTVLPWYEMHVEVDFNPDTNQYRFRGSVTNPEGAEVPVFLRWQWQYRGPNPHGPNGDLARGIYYTFQRTKYEFRTQGRYKNTYIVLFDTGDDTGWINVDTDMAADGAKDPNTGLPYEAKNELQEILITVEIILEGDATYPHFHGRKYTLVKSLAELLHVESWEDSGLIVDTSKPTPEEVLGKVMPPYVTVTPEPVLAIADPYVPDVDSPA